MGPDDPIYEQDTPPPSKVSPCIVVSVARQVAGNLSVSCLRESDAGNMKFAAGSGVLGLMLAWVGCSEAFVAPAGTGESPPLFHERTNVYVHHVMYIQDSCVLPKS